MSLHDIVEGYIDNDCDQMYQNVFIRIWRVFVPIILYSNDF